MILGKQDDDEWLWVLEATAEIFSLAMDHWDSNSVDGDIPDFEDREEFERLKKLAQRGMALLQ